MKYNIVTCYDKINLEKWDKFVYLHKYGNIFQTSGYYNAMKKSSECEPLIIILEDSNGCIVALMQTIIFRDTRKYISNMTARAITEGGPLLISKDNKILKLLFKAYLKILPSDVIYSQIRNSFSTDEIKDLYFEIGFIYDDHLNILINIKQTEEKLWEQIHSKRRNEIRKALKEGVEFRELDFFDTIDDSYRILNEVYKKAKLPLLSKENFISLYENLLPNSKLKVFNVFYEDKNIGCMFCLLYKDIIYDFYAGSFSAFYKKNPNDLLPWEVFRWGRINGYSIFDFGGAGHPNIPYGVREYKKKYGGKVVNYGRYLFVHKPFLYKIGAFAHKFKKYLL